ncbi:acyl-CoA dehydrogenase family protein [Desulfosporosinus shakirovi]|uniref:acyl-CoA dehydrogenase family protein n=1 Tax=Desulfosporosinus shakirovi TaxID=2885154 RepID=UPI001E486A53|nr:acyl-CoA dehydrogenase family protein [Desulfosporosinus sp. SRJS8]MCB8817847.1 acyl-CoA/acyl-ACP dehydrogenase [Desulfosporosinus sp. SRJS8]
MDFGLTEEHKLLKQTFKKFCDKELTKDYVAWMDENCDFIPDDLYKKLADLGLFGMTIPEEYGGAGMTFTDFMVAMEEVAIASAAVAIGAGLAVSFGAKVIGGMGTEEQKQFHLPKIAAGETKYCLALTEPGGGTDIINSMRASAVKKGKDYVLNGQKVFISGGHVADYMLVVAITDPTAAKRTKGMSVFLVDAKIPGITVNLIKKVCIHACGTTEIFFDDVVVPAENLLGQLNNGWNKLVDVLNPERIGTAMLSLGIAKAAYKEAHEYSLQRFAFGKPIGSFMVLQHYLVDMLIEIENATNLIYKCCYLLENGLPYHMEAAMAKLVAGRASEIAAIKGTEILGGYGVCMEYSMQRHFRDYKQMIFSPISDEMAKNMIAQWTGLPKSY